MHWPMIFLAILALAMVASCNIVYGNNNHGMDEVEMTTARMFLNTENNEEGAGVNSFGKRWYRPEEHRWRRHREHWRPREYRWRRW